MTGREDQKENDLFFVCSLILDVAHDTDKDIIDTLVVVYNSWITRKIDNYNSSMYYESPSYLFESYKAGAVLA